MHTHIYTNVYTHKQFHRNTNAHTGKINKYQTAHMQANRVGNEDTYILTHENKLTDTRHTHTH
jgi:hypothetical protein